MTSSHSIPFPSHPDAEWSTIQNAFSLDKNRHYESLFTLGSGYLNIRSSLPEGLTDDPQNISFDRKVGNVTVEKFHESKSKWGTYVPGFMEAHPDLNEEMINLPFPLGVIIEADGEKLDMEKGEIKNFIRWIDFRDACLRRRCEWHTQSGATLLLSFTTYIHCIYEECLFQEISIEVIAGNCSLTYGAFLDSDVRTNGFDHFVHSNTHGKSDGTADVTVRTHGGQEAAAAMHLTGAKKWQIKTEPRYVSLSASMRVNEGETHIFCKTAAVFTTLDSKTPMESALECVAKHAGCKYDEVYKEHSSLWNDIWQNMLITIEGDDETTHALRFSEYHLTRANPLNSRAAICAKMNGGDAYWGRIHWDNEMYIAPFFIYTSPEFARPLLEYRYRTLPGAQKRAQELGYPGAVYAWESGTDGTEQCPSFQYADHEIHITADVVIGMLHYYYASTDVDFLVNCIIPVAIECARYWAERIDFYPNEDDGHLLCVMGPDEYTHASDDNTYTNIIVSEALLHTSILCKLIAMQVPGVQAELEKRNVLKEEIERWHYLSRTLCFMYDEDRSLYLQSADFEYLLPVDFATIWQDRTKLFGETVSQEKLYRMRALKQADVLMIMQLFPKSFTKKHMCAAFEYYEPITTHDSSLSYTTHSIIAAWIDKPEKAWEYFVKARDLDTDPQAARAAQGIHSANAAALWQCVVFGFLGMQPAYLASLLTLTPRLPKHWDKLSLVLTWHDTRIQLHVTQTDITVIPEDSIEVNICDKKHACKATQKTKINYTNHTL